MSVVELTKITAPCPPPPQLEILAPTTHTHTHTHTPHTHTHHTAHTHTVQTANIYRHIRNTCSWEADSQQAGTSSTKLLNTPIILGGRNVTVQIDEPFFHHKPKYHRGPAPHSEQWVFDLVDTSSSPSLGHMELLSKARCPDLAPYNSGTHPSWHHHLLGPVAGQCCGTPSNSSHSTENHSVNFVDPATGVTIQNIKSYWNWVKMMVWARHNSPVTWTSSCGASNGGETRKKHISTWWQTSLHSIPYNLRVPSLSRTFLLKFLPF